ncbi:MAG: endonuclease [Bacteroidota bacterium]
MKKLALLFLALFLFSSFVIAQIPAGYYDAAAGLTGDNLRSALKTIIKTGHVKLTYTPGVWNAYAVTDVRPVPNNTTIWDMYSDIPSGTPAYTYTIYTDQCGTANSEGDCYSREHTLPNSWWGGFDDETHPQYTDLHQLFPADQYVNNYKSAHPIGQVGVATFTSTNGSKLGPCSFTGYTGVVFEPINEYKGDFARAYLYAATRYMDDMSSWATTYSTTEFKYIFDVTTNNYKQWFIDMLILWNNSDPVSTKEINRNNAIYYNSGQHNRNPFVDHPEYVAAVWVPNNGILPEPTNHAASFSAHNLLLEWSDATGANMPDGYLIRMDSISFNNIMAPVDGVPVTENHKNKLVSYGVQQILFTNLTSNTTYYFKMYPYTGSGNVINYKTDGLVPQAQQTTTP